MSVIHNPTSGKKYGYYDFYDVRKARFYRIPTKISKVINTDILLDFNQIDGIISMLNSNDEGDINLAVEIIKNLNHQMGYEVLVYRLMNTSHNWALSDDGSELVRRVYNK